MILLLASFSHKFYAIFFQWSLSDNKFPQTPRTLLSILVDFKSSLIWTVSILSLISSSFRRFSASWGLFQVHQLRLASPSPSCSITFLALKQDPNICLSFHFLLLSVYWDDKIYKMTFSFLLNF